MGSGARVTDLMPIPVPLFILARLIKFIFKHWYITIIILLYFFAPTYLLILFALSLPLIIYTYVQLTNRHHSPAACVRAARHLLRSKIKWTRACEAATLNDGPRRPRLICLLPTANGWRPPRIENEQGTALTFTLNLSSIGQTVQHLEENREYISAVLNARRTRVHRLTPGKARFTIEWEKNLSRSAVANSKQTLRRTTQLPLIELDQDVSLELDTSLLVVGESGSGKSNLTWNAINSLNEHQVPYRLYVIDPKKVELADLAHSPYTVQYEDSIKDVDRVIDAFHKDMMDTFRRMKQSQTRKIEINEDNPLKILIIDEILLCSRQLKNGATDTPLGDILSSGRAAGYIVIADAQLGQVDVIGRIRDLFPQRICMAVKSSDLTNATLGPQAEQRGARCTEITVKGEGYIYTDHAGTFQRFRSPFIPDQETSRIAAGQVYTPPEPQSPFSGINLHVPDSMKRNRNRPAYVYRLYHTNGDLLYIGKAVNPSKRMKQHDENQPWWPQVDHSLTIIEKYPTEPLAEEAELEAIRLENPRFNLVGKF